MILAAKSLTGHAMGAIKILRHGYDSGWVGVALLNVLAIMVGYDFLQGHDFFVMMLGSDELHHHDRP